jgi:hypothetical protein
MTVGFGIFLIAVGAIIRYALDVEIAGVEEGTLGLILILAGIAVVVLGLFTTWLWTSRRGRDEYARRDADYRYR